MFPIKLSVADLVADLTATRSTSVVAAAVLACTFLPMVGGPIKPHEVREFRAGVTALMNGETSTPSLYPVYHPEWGGAAPLLPARADHNRARVVNVAYVPAAADEFELDLAGGALEEQPTLTPVIQVLQEPEEICSDTCAEEAAPLEEAETADVPEVESAEEFAKLMIG